ncbi:hypothetical protein L210DRAFT_573275 [Boletus edulis BED1]|uniref:Uncharacterized protein n=1 Tax=Boletus edulis BED1 TaxID=1328754 RepID=A0AAD4C9G6_BOLED|nr:hypothetical protein L210DRAFT_573275 [Boletus edulis BED1]
MWIWVRQCVLRKCTQLTGSHDHHFGTALILVSTYMVMLRDSTCRRVQASFAARKAGRPIGRYGMYQISRFIDCSVLALICTSGDTRIRR